MASHTDVVADDLEVISERLQPYAPRADTRRKLRELHEEYQARVARLEELFDGRRLSCPIHEDTEDVIITGNGRNGTKKFKCRQYHDPEQTGRDTTEFRFSTFTSYEALSVYQDFLLEALSLLATCEGTYAGIAEYLHLSKHLVEFGVATLLDYLDDLPTQTNSFDIADDEDLIVVYADFSSTRVSRTLSLIMGRIEGDICYFTCPSMNWLTAWNFVRGIDERLGKTDATVVFVTDGEVAWLDPIRSFFPEAIHVRQFHSSNSRGIVYVHLPVEDQLYTVRVRWDAVLEAGTPSENAQRMRRRRQLAADDRRTEDGEVDSWTDVSDDVFVWEGVVTYPRGARRKTASSAESESAAEDETQSASETGEGADPGEAAPADDGVTGTEATTADEGATGAEAPPAAEASPSPTANPESASGSDREKNPEAGEAVASGGDGVERLFRGSIEDAREYPAADRTLDVLEEVFGGQYITSNVAESLFHVKPALTAHRTVKRGDAFIRLFLFLRTQLNGQSRQEIRSFFRDEVVTLDRLQTIGVQQDGAADPAPDPEEVVLQAHWEGEPVVISYEDRYGRKTRRMIEPLSVEVDRYSGATRVASFCYLRQAERTFLLGRIHEAIPVDTDLSVVSANAR